MPDNKSKRRKNKNKRKNKTNSSGDTKNTNNVVDNDSLASSSDAIQVVDQLDNTNKEQIAELNTNENVVVDSNQQMQNLTENHNVTDNICDNSLGVQQDCNNNNDIQNPQQATLIEPEIILHDIPQTVDDISESQNYIVESPEQSLLNKPKLNNNVKSKSLDNDDATKIVDVTDDIEINSSEDNTLPVIDSNNVLVSDVESDVEWEKTGDLQDTAKMSSDEPATGTISVTAVPLNIAHCQEMHSLSPEVETSLRNYLRTLNLSQNPENINSVEIKAEIEQIIDREIRHRLRKKAMADDFFSQRLGLPRTLDVIDEEGSSESSLASRRQSYLSDKKSDNEDLEDDVFEDKNKVQENLRRRTDTVIHKKTIGRLIPQECFLVGAKIKEPEVSEARGDWTTQNVAQMTGAEIVYLTDTSSSTSSIHDVSEETDDGMETDVSVRMITPTIEVIDTENLLKNTFVTKKNVKSQVIDESKTTMDANNKIDSSKDISLNVDENNPHEILVLSTDDIKTNLYVKELNVDDSKTDKNVENQAVITSQEDLCDENHPQTSEAIDIEIKALRFELNDALNNLIKEVSDSEIQENSKNNFVRQDSSSSVCSSQCTAKYNPTSSSLNDVSNIMHDDSCENNTLHSENDKCDSFGSHVKEVIEHVTGSSPKSKKPDRLNQPLVLRDLCVRKIASFPYGEKILEELASVSERLQNIASGKIVPVDKLAEKKLKPESMPYYPLPDLSSIDQVVFTTKTKDPIPPPIQPRNSSLKKPREEEIWTGVPTKTEPVYVCLSPSQKMLMEKTQTVISKEDASELANMHKKYVDRRGYDENVKEKFRSDQITDTTPIVPFKSQTGSRLLALIRDPTLTSSINALNQYSSENFIEKKSKFEKMSQPSSHNYTTISNLSNTFKPIPPPRPKKLSAFYESDESSDFTDSSFRSMKSDRKFFHYSTGNLNKEIEDDVSSIQHMHRCFSNTREKINNLGDGPRRPSLPKDLCDQQMEYIRQKEKEVEAEIRRLEAQSDDMKNGQTRGPKAPIISEKEIVDERIKDSDNYFISRKKEYVSGTQFPEKKETERSKLSSVFSKSQEELLRDKMYSEYVRQMAEREERKLHKVIKISNTSAVQSSKVSKSTSSLDVLDSKVNNRIEKEFICKARERWDKLGIKDPETEDERALDKNVYREPKVIEHKIKVIEGGAEKEVGNLPSHLQEFVRFTTNDKEQKAESSGESSSEPASPHVVIWCAVIIIVLAIGKYFMRLLRNK